MNKHIYKKKVNENFLYYRGSGLYFGGLNKAGALPLTESFALATLWNDFQLLTRVSRLSYRRQKFLEDFRFV